MKAARTRQRIERTALELFERDGYDNVSVRRIAEAAGVTERTYFRHFATKIEPLMGNPARSINDFAGLLREQPTHLDPLEAVLASIAHEEAERPSNPDDVVRRRILAATPSLLAEVRSFERAIEQCFVEWLAERTGRRADDFEVVAAASILVATRRSVVNAWTQANGEVSLLSLSKRALAMIELHLDDPAAESGDDTG